MGASADTGIGDAAPSSTDVAAEAYVTHRVPTDPHRGVTVELSDPTEKELIRWFKAAKTDSERRAAMHYLNKWYAERPKGYYDQRYGTPAKPEPRPLQIGPVTVEPQPEPRPLGIGQVTVEPVDRPQAVKSPQRTRRSERGPEPTSDIGAEYRRTMDRVHAMVAAHRLATAYPNDPDVQRHMALLMSPRQNAENQRNAATAVAGRPIADTTAAHAISAHPATLSPTMSRHREESGGEATAALQMAMGLQQLGTPEGQR